MPVTDDRDDPRLKNVDPETNMQEAYLVLSEEERAKGFVRPVRRSYQHVGRPICGKVSTELEAAPPGLVWACAGLPGHEGPCRSWIGCTPTEAAEGRRGGCGGTVTTMGVALAETYAAQPTFYGATYCVSCQNHFPVGAYGEFVWEGTDVRVGT